MTGSISSTHGQPYLTQLIGHNLITRLNTEIFEQQVDREPRFGLADVEAVIADENFYRTGAAYFQGVWAQAGQGPAGQQTILRALAAAPANASELAAKLGLDIAEVDAALDFLRRHDMIQPVTNDPQRWQVTVDLMRIWLARQEPLRVAQ